MKKISTKAISKKRAILFALCLAASVLVTLASSAFLPIREEKLYDSVIRLHVIANSDGETDQRVKLMVRDAILAEAENIFSDKGMDEAMAVSMSNLSHERLTEIAEKVLSDNGLAYGAVVVFGKEDYPTREYDGVTFPAGKYYSLRVVLGEGEGQNWWCVLFPPLCLGSSAVIIKATGSKSEAYSSKNSTFKFKIKILEMFG
ncbi:MAG: stage II sporulation protein R [Eubacteriales bacterium]|nr:stage II sporulation protein R [Eubacteriales bacterium]